MAKKYAPHPPHDPLWKDISKFIGSGVFGIVAYILFFPVVLFIAYGLILAGDIPWLGWSIMIFGGLLVMAFILRWTQDVIVWVNKKATSK